MKDWHYLLLMVALIIIGTPLLARYIEKSNANYRLEHPEEFCPACGQLLIERNRE